MVGRSRRRHDSRYNTIEAITYRDNPIWPLCATGRPADDSQIAPAVGVSAEVTALLRNADLPITAAWLLVDTSCHWMIITVPRNWRDVLPGIAQGNSCLGSES
jgi:UbiD family decarboxylase